VRGFIPADFGSCDSSSPRALELVPLYRAKKAVRECLVELAGKGSSDGSGFSWTSLVCGHFFDFGLKSGLLQFDLAARPARIFDGGDVRWSATTLDTIGTAVVRVLQRGEATRNGMLSIQSFCVSQNQVLAVLERVVAGGTWEVEHVDSDEFIRSFKGKLDEGDPEAQKELVSVLGMVDADWERKEGFANELLGLQDEDLERVVRKVVAS
jgi:hypothetical protein